MDIVWSIQSFYAVCCIPHGIVLEGGIAMLHGRIADRNIENCQDQYKNGNDTDHGDQDKATL